MDHPTQRRLTEMLAGNLSEEDASILSGHLAFCHGCAERMQALRAIQSNFEPAWDVLVDSLAGNTPPSMLAVAVRVLLDGARHLAAAGTEAVRELSSYVESCNLNLCPVASGVGDPEDLAAARRLHQKAADLCDQGLYSAATEELLQAEQIAPGGAEVVEVEVTGHGIRGFVNVDAQSGAITVRAYASPAWRLEHRGTPETQASPGRVSLVDEAGQVVRTEPLQAIHEADYYFAEFEAVEDGGWIVKLEVD